ncbi:MAG: monofunctional biosynthetic peptidoglycan transglycosylase [Pseudomonadota bacterium]
MSTRAQAKRARSQRSAAKPADRGQSSRWGFGLRRFLRRLALLSVALFLTLAAIPLVFVPVYAFVDPPFSTLMLRDLLKGENYERQWVDFDDIAPVVPQTVVMSEDAAFCSHWGVDLGAMREAIETWRDGGALRGASTVSMQTAKNLFLWPDRSFLRKAIEVPLAGYMDLIWSKRRMMEIYLNIVEWDEGIYGIGAAAEHHFGRTPMRLTRRQAALLVAALPLPRIRNPARPSSRHARVARIIERRSRDAARWTGCLFPDIGT